MAEPYLSEMRIIGFNFPPRDWALCDGAMLSIDQNQALYSLLGTAYGGDGRTTFQLPDMRGRTPLHLGNSYSLGQTGGEENVALEPDTMPSHNHGLVAGSDNTNHEPNDHYLGSNVPLYQTNTTVDTNLHSSTLENTGSGATHNNQQPFLGLNFIIATTGTFPSRN